MAQQHLTGVVVSPDNEPMVGASVVVDGTTVTTVTDFEGRFELAVPDNAILIVSYKGYPTQRVSAATLRDGSELRIVLSETGKLAKAEYHPRPHRFVAWAAGGALSSEGAFLDPDRSSTYTSVAGEIGVGYQLYIKHFIFTTGAEVLLTNYKVAASVAGMSARIRDYGLQVPFWFGAEYPWWYVQGGAKIGFFSYTDIKLSDPDYPLNYTPAAFAFALTPALEVGTNIYSERTGVNVKFGAFAESRFNQQSAADQSQKSGFAFSCFMAGLKLTIAY